MRTHGGPPGARADRQHHSDTEVRAAGLGLPYALSVAVFGGTAPFAIEWLNSREMAGVFPWYVAALCAITLVSALALGEGRHRNCAT
ncbi:hypothetical protein [Streptomyces sp. NPDC005336]|uniref:hypothetical protein n=1 Tax=Streptomyces sp. NPDC005336 TaxID=3157035 RepID=UPI0033B4619C